ncbi:MAG TPA: hypothetical protein VGM73_03695 [Candidatus Didemnitutus sp.]
MHSEIVLRRWFLGAIELLFCYLKNALCLQHKGNMWSSAILVPLGIAVGGFAVTTIAGAYFADALTLYLRSKDVPERNAVSPAAAPAPVPPAAPSIEVKDSPGAAVASGEKASAQSMTNSPGATQVNDNKASVTVQNIFVFGELTPAQRSALPEIKATLQKALVETEKTSGEEFKKLFPDGFVIFALDRRSIITPIENPKFPSSLKIDWASANLLVDDDGFRLGLPAIEYQYGRYYGNTLKIKPPYTPGGQWLASPRDRLNLYVRIANTIPDGLVAVAGLKPDFLTEIQDPATYSPIDPAHLESGCVVTLKVLLTSYWKPFFPKDWKLVVHLPSGDNFPTQLITPAPLTSADRFGGPANAALDAKQYLPGRLTDNPMPQNRPVGGWISFRCDGLDVRTITRGTLFRLSLNNGEGSTFEGWFEIRS